MRTTVRLNDALLDQVRHEAAARGQTLTALIELGLTLVLSQSREAGNRPKIELPVCHEGGGTLPGVDLDNSAALLDIMDGVA